MDIKIGLVVQFFETPCGLTCISVAPPRSAPCESTAWEYLHGPIVL